MENVAFLYPDYFQPSVSYSPVISGGSWQPTLPLVNLQSQLLSKPARSTNLLAASTKLVVDLGVARPVGMLAIGKHNGSSAGTVVAKLSNVADFSATVHTSAALPLWPAGKIAEDMDGYNVNWFYTPPEGLTATRYVELDFSDPANPAGYLDLARLMIGGKFQPAVGFHFGGVNIGWEDPTKVDTSKGGVDWFDIMQPFRVKRFQLDDLSDSEAYDTVFEMQRRLGKHGQTFISFDPAATGFRRWQRSFLCTMRHLSPIEWPYAGGNSVGFEAKEVL